jgi:hypothetical protein
MWSINRAHTLQTVWTCRHFSPWALHLIAQGNSNNETVSRFLFPAGAKRRHVLYSLKKSYLVLYNDCRNLIWKCRTSNMVNTHNVKNLQLVLVDNDLNMKEKWQSKLCMDIQWIIVENMNWKNIDIVLFQPNVHEVSPVTTNVHWKWCSFLGNHGKVTIWQWRMPDWKF